MAYGKIARLPREIREQLNRRLGDAEPGARLLKWLNGLPEVRRVLDDEFAGHAVNAQNLSDWRQHGHKEWLAHQEKLACAEDLTGRVMELPGLASDPGSLADRLAMELSARYAQLLAGWNGEMDAGFRRRARGLGMLCRHFAELRRYDHSATRLIIQRERFLETKKSDATRALELALDETKQWPEVMDVFRNAFALLKEKRKADTKPNTSS
jgi:hypothetical protein